MTSREPLVGHRNGDYLVVDTLSQGGFGKVLPALQAPRFELRAALKLMEVARLDSTTKPLAISGGQPLDP